MSDAGKMAVLFADIAGSTSLYEKQGDRVALARISTCLTRLSAATEKIGGRVVKTIGDEVMCAFADAADAVRAATEMQLAQQAARDGLGLRVGFHFGDVIQRNGDVFGDSVNVAARVAALAKAGQILMTSATLQKLPSYMRSGARPMGQIGVRGKEQPLDLCEFVWSWADNLTMVDGVHPVARADGHGRLRIEHGSVVREFSGSGSVLCFGRDTGNDIVVDCPKASRQHGRIEVRQSGFVVVDQSTNGTYIMQDAGGEILLRREEALLQGAGAIGPGESVSTAAHRRKQAGGAGREQGNCAGGGDHYFRFRVRNLG